MRNGELLSRTESAALRGIAILGIILHNYCHFLGFAVKENEYKFDSSRPMQFFDKLFSLDSDLFIHIFSFLGKNMKPIPRQAMKIPPIGRDIVWVLLSSESISSNSSV